MPTNTQSDLKSLTKTPIKSRQGNQIKSKHRFSSMHVDEYPS